MNKLFFLLTKEDSVKTPFSSDVDFVFNHKNAFVDCTIVDKTQNKSFCLKNLDTAMLKRFLSIKTVTSSINKQFDEYLDVHYEAKQALSETLFFLQNKASITPENKHILRQVLTLTSENFSCPLTENNSLKMLTSCNKKAKAGYDLHFQLCITKGEKIVMPWQGEAETLAQLHKILLENKQEVVDNLQSSLLHQHIKSSENIILFNKLKNRFMEEHLEK